MHNRCLHDTHGGYSQQTQSITSGMLPAALAQMQIQKQHDNILKIRPQEWQ
jgi:ABC-type sulfate transport system substrate-binding protein